MLIFTLGYLTGLINGFVALMAIGRSRRRRQVAVDPTALAGEVVAIFLFVRLGQLPLPATLLDRLVYVRAIHARDENLGKCAGMVLVNLKAVQVRDAHHELTKWDA
jgi:hypothetical protein